MNTYTIAIDSVSGLLLACVPDGQDVDAAVSAATDEAGISADIAASVVQITSGVTLTNDEDAGDVIYRGSAMGYLTDSDGRTGYQYAVRA